MPGWDWNATQRYLFNPYLLAGAWTTVWLSAAAMLAGLVLGLIAALMRLSRLAPLRALAAFYVWLMRGTPLLVQLIIIFTGLPQLGIRLTVIQSALLGFSLNEGAYLSEIIRAGILSVPRGQFDAARALGMSSATTMRVVILPQAARVIIPPLGNNFNGLLKTTSLASVISMEELLRRSQMLIQLEFRVLEIFTVTALYYLALTSVWGIVQGRIEARLERAYGPARPSRARHPYTRDPARSVDGSLLQHDQR
jgi:polar amino acid transport system permease protein